MGIGPKWSTTALLGAAAGVGAALAHARRGRSAFRPPPAASLGVDGLGEAQSAGIDMPPAPVPPVVTAPTPLATDAGEDAVAALDRARERLRQRADALAQEMDPDDS